MTHQKTANIIWFLLVLYWAMDVIYNFYYNLHPRPRVTIMTEYRRVIDRQTDRQTDIPKADTCFTVPQRVEG